MKFYLFIYLCSLILTTNALTMPANNASRGEYLTYYSQCATVDPEFVIDDVLDVFIGTIQWLNDDSNNPFSVGWMVPGPANDLGWSYNLYLAAQAQQRCFGVKWYVEDQISEDDVVNAMNRLIDKDIKLLMATSAEFVGSVGEVALANPDIMFVIPFPVEAYFGIPNIRSVSMNVFETTYLTGYIAEAMTDVNIPYVGAIGAIHLFTEYQNQNAFLFGMQDAAAKLNREPRTMVYWWINTYSSVDKTTFAVKDIANNYDVKIVSQTPDNYDPQLWLRDNGYYGTGATADMGQFLGSTVYASNHVRWDVPGLYIYGLLVAAGTENWGSTPLVLPHSVWLGSLGPGTLSVDTPEDIANDIDNIMKLMQSNQYASGFIWCGERAAKLLPEGEELEGGCLSLYQLLSMNKLHPDILDLGDYEIPLEEVTISDGIQIFESVVLTLTFIFNVLLLVVFVIKRNTAIIKLSSVVMSWLCLFGTIISLIGLSLYIPDPDADLCRASFSMYLIGYFIIYGAFSGKIYGFGLMYRSSSKLKQRTINWITVMPVVIPTIVIGFAFVIWWLADDNIGTTTLTQEDTTELDKYEFRKICDLSDNGTIAIGMAFGYGLLINIVTLICNHIVGRNFLAALRADTRSMIITSWCTLVCGSIGLTLTLSLSDDQDTLEIMLFFLAWLTILSVLLLYYGPKLWVIFRNTSPEAMPMKQYKRKLFISNSNSNTSPRNTGSQFSSRGDSTKIDIIDKNTD